MTELKIMQDVKKALVELQKKNTDIEKKMEELQKELNLVKECLSENHMDIYKAVNTKVILR